MRALYKGWPDQELADELFAMRRAVEEHPEDAERWAVRLAAAEREASKRRPRRPKRYREPIGQRFARRMLGDVMQPEPAYRDFEPGLRYVIEDERGDLWGVGPGDRCQRLSLFRPAHLGCIRNSRRDRVVVWTEWEYLESLDSETGEQ